MKNITLDGYEYILTYRQPTTMNTLCVYKIQNIHNTNENPVYFLASGELRERFIRESTFNEMKTHIMPQHYEGYFKDEFTAILMAKNVAMDTYITLQESALEEAQKTLSEVSEKLAKLQSKISWEGCDAFKQYYNSQDELRKTALNREKEDKNK
jgi:hypothetical protein